MALRAPSSAPLCFAKGPRCIRFSGLVDGLEDGVKIVDYPGVPEAEDAVAVLV